MLNEKSQPQNDTYCIIPLTRGTKEVNFIDIKSGMVIVRGWGVKSGM